MNEDILNRMSDAIEQLLADMRAPAHVVEGWLTPGLVTFRLKPVSGTRVDAVMRLRNDLALILRAPSVRIGRQIGYITVQVPNGAPDVSVDDMLRNADVFAGAPPTTAPLGIADDGAPVLLHLGDNTSNVLISGLMGSGKTTLAHSLLIGLAARTSPRSLRMIVCDPKRHDLGWMMRRIGAHVEANVRHDIGEIAAAIGDVARRVEQARGRERDVLLFVDELGWVLSQAPAAIEPLKRIMKRGREFGFRLVACEPTPGTAPLAGDLLASFHVRITGRQADAGAAYSATGISESGAETLQGAGDMLAVHFGQVTRFRAVRPPREFTGQRLMPVAEIPAAAPTPAPEAASISVDIPAPAAAAISDADAARMAAELEADRRVFAELTVGDQYPGVTRWSAARFGDQWTTPYAGDRVKWMRARYDAAWNDVVAGTVAASAGTDSTEYAIARRLAEEALSAAKACWPGPKPLSAALSAPKAPGDLLSEPLSATKAVFPAPKATKDAKAPPPFCPLSGRKQGGGGGGA